MKINISELRRVCLIPEENLIPSGERFHFIDNGANVLAIAHCDFVKQTGEPDFASYTYKGQTFVMSEALDDRLGVYLITRSLPALGINVDVLLTTDEEKGQSTGSLFKPTKDYNWMFELDRRGTDVVAYAYDDKDLDDKVLEVTGQKLGRGSASDISKMEDLGIKGLNFGCGYHAEHSVGCYATISDIYTGLSNFVAFFDAYKDIKLPHTKKVWTTPFTSKAHSRNWWDKKDYEDNPNNSVNTWSHCNYCGSEEEVHWNNKVYKFLCKFCNSVLEDENKTPKTTVILLPKDNSLCELCKRFPAKKHEWLFGEEYELCHNCSGRVNKLRTKNTAYLKGLVDIMDSARRKP